VCMNILAILLNKILATVAYSPGVSGSS